MEMQKYVGVKPVMAKPMTLGAYNKLRGWEMPIEELPETEGYLVEYLDGGKANHPDFLGYISWCPKEQFENANRKTVGLTFGHAIEMAKKGSRIARAGWNGKGMFVYYVPANSYPASGNTLGTMAGVFPDDLVPYGAYLAMKTAQNNVIPWLASQSDILEEDWVIV